MKTIAISIDEHLLKSVDRLARTGSRNRSEVVRAALSEYLLRLEKSKRESEERKIWEKHYDRINRQTRAQVEDQADL